MKCSEILVVVLVLAAFLGVMCYSFFTASTAPQPRSTIITSEMTYEAVSWELFFGGIRFRTPEGKEVMIRGDFIREEQ